MRSSMSWILPSSLRSASCATSTPFSLTAPARSKDATCSPRCSTAAPSSSSPTITSPSRSCRPSAPPGASRKSGVPYAVVVTKADPRLGAEFIIDAWNTLEREGIRHFRTVIREYRAWPNSLKNGVPITRWNERYAPKLREDVASLHTELLLDLGRRASAGVSA